MTRAMACKLLSSLPPEEAGKLLDLAMKSVGPPKSKRHTEKNTGIYNAVALPEITAQVLSVKDDGKKAPDFELLGQQQVLCSRTLSPPVMIEYVSRWDAFNHDAKIAKELERLRPKG